jgi:hypothetical protein
LRRLPCCFREFSGFQWLLSWFLWNPVVTRHMTSFSLYENIFMNETPLIWFLYQIIRKYSFYEWFCTHHKRFFSPWGFLWW